MAEPKFNVGDRVVGRDKYGPDFTERVVKGVISEVVEFEECFDYWIEGDGLYFHEHELKRLRKTKVNKTAEYKARIAELEAELSRVKDKCVRLDTENTKLLDENHALDKRYRGLDQNPDAAYQQSQIKALQDKLNALVNDVAWSRGALEQALKKVDA